jgi:hypothetical protein
VGAERRFRTFTHGFAPRYIFKWEGLTKSVV